MPESQSPFPLKSRIPNVNSAKSRIPKTLLETLLAAGSLTSVEASLGSFSNDDGEGNENGKNVIIIIIIIVIII